MMVEEALRPGTGGTAAVAVLDTSEVARRIAVRLRLPIAEPSVPSDRPLLVVVSRPAELPALQRLGSALAIVVAWRLDEASVAHLHDLGVPVLVGLPDADQVRSLLAGNGAQGQADRKVALRLAALEAALAR